MTEVPVGERVFATLHEGGLDRNSLPMRLFRKGNLLFWDPAAIDFSTDAEDWAGMTGDEQDLSLKLAAFFLAGEEAVTHDIQPFIRAVGAEGRLEDEIYLTQFAFEEAKHVLLFRTWLDAIGVTRDLHDEVRENPGYRRIFYDALPSALGDLDRDPSPANQVRAAAVYNQVVEGVLAITGYHSWRRASGERGILPGMQTAVGFTSRDERRHMAWGTYTCRRHIAADPSNWSIIEETLGELLEPTLSIIDVVLSEYERAGKPIPFGVTKEELVSFATTQFSRRLEVIEAARHARVEEIEGVEEEGLERELELEDLATIPGPVGS